MTDSSHGGATAGIESEDQVEEEAEYLRLSVQVLDSKIYNLEYPRTAEKLLGLEDRSKPQRWYRKKDSEGGGSFGVLFRESLREKTSGTELEARAVKVIKKSALRQDLRITGNRQSEPWKRELRALIYFSRLKYQDTGLFVVFRGWYDDTDSVSLVTEWISHGNLESVVISGAYLPEKDVAEIAIQVLMGLRFMHEAHFAHRDLKPENILVVQKGPARGGIRWRVKLADFGFTKEVAGESILQTMRGTEGYMAPEVSREDEPDDVESSAYTPVVDIWSAGCVLFRLLSGGVPKNEPRSRTFQKNIPQYLREKLLGKEVTEDCLSALEGMIRRNPSTRFSADAALETPWLTQHATGRTRNPRTSACLTRSISPAQRQQAIAIVKTFIGTLPDSPRPSTSQLIHQAVSEGNLDVLRSLLRVGVDANALISNGDGTNSQTPLIVIAGSLSRDNGNWPVIMQQLYDGGCDVNAQPGVTGVTALFAAAEAGLVDKAAWLLEHGARSSLGRYCKGLLPLHVASQGADPGHVQVVQRLLQEGIDINANADLPQKQTALHIAAHHGRTITMDVLLRADANINQQTQVSYRTPLHVAVVGMGPSEVQPLPEKAKRVVKGQRLPDDVPPASTQDSLDTTRLLIRYRPQLHVGDMRGMTPMHYTAKYLLNEQANDIISAAEEGTARTQRLLPDVGLRTLCRGESAYKMAWETAKARKEPPVIADRLESGGHVTDEERAVRRKATQDGFFRDIFRRTQNATGGSNFTL